jgi:hypothetical protein
LGQIPPRSGKPVALAARAARFRRSSTDVMIEQANYVAYRRTL